MFFYNPPRLKLHPTGFRTPLHDSQLKVTRNHVGLEQGYEVARSKEHGPGGAGTLGNIKFALSTQLMCTTGSQKLSLGAPSSIKPKIVVMVSPEFMGVVLGGPTEA